MAKKAAEEAAKRKSALSKRVPSPPPPPKPPANPKVVKKIRAMKEKDERRKDLAQKIKAKKAKHSGASDIGEAPTKDRIVLIVRDPYWLHVSWEICEKSVTRAKTALSEHWHSVKPILRVLKIDSSSATSNEETHVRDIEIHGGVRNWYVDATDPPASYRVLIGYLQTDGKFYELCRSNVATTPRPGSSEASSEHWLDVAKDASRIFAMSGGFNGSRENQELRDMFEERLNRPMGVPSLAKFGSGAEAGMRRSQPFHFDVDAELIVFGSTVADAYVTLGGEQVKVESDGSFSIRVPLPDKRQVLPATSCTRDGVEEQTIVIAVERNTKVMEPITNDTEADE